MRSCQTVHIFSRPISDQPIKYIGILLEASYKCATKEKNFKKIQLTSKSVFTYVYLIRLQLIACRFEIQNINTRKKINVRKKHFNPYLFHFPLIVITISDLAIQYLQRLSTFDCNINNTLTTSIITGHTIPFRVPFTVKSNTDISGWPLR